ncbi:SLAM family member 5-like [Dendropsophus ebraccatus]|uniref:SLAM family member 5-like n=1 Tax=Dendropsophus ebraccatus TaxID=150705 RepID=UPI0038318B36
MMSTYCHLLLLLSLHKCVSFHKLCGAMRNLSAVEGADVILQADEKEITEISWVFKGFHIATTKPQNFINIKRRNDRSRLHTDPSCSLGIRPITMEDSGMFMASVFKEEEECKQMYNLTVHSSFSDHDLQVHHNVSGDGSCFLTCVVGKPDVTTIWSIVNSSYTERTPTLRLNNTRMNLTWVCNVDNKVINASKIIEPWTLCYDGTKDRNMIMIFVGCCIFLLLVVAIACFLKKNMTTQCSICGTKPKNVPPNEDLQDANPYYEIIMKEDPAYETVGNKDKEGEEMMKLNTIYAKAAF